MSQRDRQRVIRSFGESESIRVFLVSLRSGGVGLNLTAATHAYLIDIWWNPAVEEQAINRIHRIGQTQPVVVRQLVVRNSVEERLLTLQAKKESMVRRALARSAESSLDERMQDLRMLFS
jgi:SNF2 family DNA or RNA helicase